jgi:hypothetical protein
MAPSSPVPLRSIPHLPVPVVTTAPDHCDRRRCIADGFRFWCSGPVTFTVSKVSPACRGIGRFSVAGVLATSLERTARAIRPLLVALLALAILLLALASLPRVAVAEPRFNSMLARHRLEIAGLGAAALIAVAVTFLGA